MIYGVNFVKIKTV